MDQPKHTFPAAMGLEHLLHGHAVNARVFFRAGQQAGEFVAPLVVADMRDQLGLAEHGLVLAKTRQLCLLRGLQFECQARIVHSLLMDSNKWMAVSGGFSVFRHAHIHLSIYAITSFATRPTIRQRAVINTGRCSIIVGPYNNRDRQP